MNHFNYHKQMIANDDASRLTLSTVLTQSSSNSDCSNWHVRE